MKNFIPIFVFLLICNTAFSSEKDDWLDVLNRDYPNLLYNPGAETPGWFRKDQPALWQYRPTMTRDVKVNYSGKNSFRFTGPGKGYTFQSGGVALIPETDYIASAWVKTFNVKGKGITLEFIPSAKISRQFVSGSKDWTRIKINFRTGKSWKRGHFRIRYDLEEGDIAWVDDVRLAPKDSQLRQADAPVFGLEKQKYHGGVLITMHSKTPECQIRYTTDGSEPHELSTLFRGKFLLLDKVTVRAKAFHNGFKGSKTHAEKMDLTPRSNFGVPFYPIDWNQTVDEWWKNHSFNPNSPNNFEKVVSPQPVINVAEVRKANPQTTTAGIAEALKRLPSKGGTLYFPKKEGPYRITAPEKAVNSYYYSQGAILLHRRSNIHFLSDGAEIQCSSAVFGISSLEFLDKRTFNRPVRNFYFRGLHFNGIKEADIALNFIHACDVLIKDCTFTNFAPSRQAEGKRSWKNHPAPIVVTAMSDNVWVRNCTFSGSRWGVYWDGVHNGGILNCDFPGPFAAGGVLIMTNNDMAPFSPTQRNAQFIVIAGNNFHGGNSAVNLSSSNCLVINNKAKDLKTFFTQHGRPKSNVQRGITYEIYGNSILQNELEGVSVFSAWAMPCRSFGKRSPNVIAGNNAKGLDLILTHDFNRPDYLENIVIRKNKFAGTKFQPQIRLNPKADRLINNIVVQSNKLLGTPRPFISDRNGKAAKFKGIIVAD